MGEFTLNRRAFLAGKNGKPAKRRYHVSSAVVTVMPGRMSSVVRRISSMPGVEVNAHDGYRIVIVMEAENTGELGGRLTEISALDGVIAANMVFEQVEEPEGNEP